MATHDLVGLQFRHACDFWAQFGLSVKLPFEETRRDERKAKGGRSREEECLVGGGAVGGTPGSHLTCPPMAINVITPLHSILSAPTVTVAAYK